MIGRVCVTVAAAARWCSAAEASRSSTFSGSFSQYCGERTDFHSGGSGAALKPLWRLLLLLVPETCFNPPPPLLLLLLHTHTHTHTHTYSYSQTRRDTFVVTV